jgi:hypothetical protein
MLLLPLGGVFFNRFQEIEERDLWGGTVLARIIEGMDGPI